MPVELIEDLKQKYTDQYVVVDARRPELARFREHVGQIKTVNMNGRALVQFADYHLSTGWFDIDLDYLKVIEKPEALARQPAEKKQAAPAKKPVATGAAAPAGEKKLSPLEMARMQGAAGKGAAAPAKAAPAGKPSTADILAAARGSTSSPAKTTAAEPAPARPAPAGKPSTADILAMARSKAPAAPAASAPTQKPPAPAATPSGVAEVPSPPSAPEPAPSKAPAEKIDRKSMTVDQILAWCRQHDAK